MIEKIDKIVVLRSVISRLVRWIDKDVLGDVIIDLMEDIMWKDNVLRSVEINNLKRMKEIDDELEK